MSFRLCSSAKCSPVEGAAEVVGREQDALDFDCVENALNYYVYMPSDETTYTS